MGTAYAKVERGMRFGGGVGAAQRSLKGPQVFGEGWLSFLYVSTDQCYSSLGSPGTRNSQLEPLGENPEPAGGELESEAGGAGVPSPIFQAGLASCRHQLAARDGVGSLWGLSKAGLWGTICCSLLSTGPLSGPHPLL